MYLAFGHMAEKKGTAVAGPEATQVRYDPTPLNQARQVTALLESLGLGAFDPSEVTSYIGRNDNWSGPTTTGDRVFVKRLDCASPEEARRRFDRTLAFETLLSRHHDDRLSGPRYLGSDPAALLVAFELLDDARTGAELATDEAFDESLCQRAGEITAALHNLVPDSTVLDSSPHPLPHTQHLNAIPIAAFTGASIGELETWRLLQGDPELMAALEGLRRQEAEIPDQRPIHGDMRLDQFLLTGRRLLLTDWEELRIGDPARDVGAFIGEWLRLSAYGIPGALLSDSDHGIGHEASHQEILAQGVRNLDRLRPLMAAFWCGYRTARQAADDRLAVRAVAFAGWHMFDRMFASATVNGRLTATDRAVAGIGRKLVLAPGRFTDVLGLGGPS